MPNRSLITFELSKGELEERQKQLAAIRNRVSARPAMKYVAILIRNELKQNFDSSGAHLGDAWPANEATYMKHKMLRYGQSKPLHRTLYLRRAVATKYGVDHVERLSRYGFQYGVSDGSKAAELLRIHRSGLGDNPKRDAMPIAGLSSKIGPRITKMILDYIVHDKLPTNVQGGD